MTDFYLKIDDRVLGPFSGVEVREAALAGVVSPRMGISNSPQGPWTLASLTGLFSESNIPLPHPEGTHVPQFRLTGVSEALQGPFKLRELIGFAVRRMLPPDALLQSDSHSHWVPVTRINVLSACLQGDLIAGQRCDGGAAHRTSEDCQVDARWRGEKAVATEPAGVSTLQQQESATVPPPPADCSWDMELESQQANVETVQPSLDEYNALWRESLRKRRGFGLPKLPG
ncbi:MAG: hypothetical protein MI861_23720, partial [Pirellulales bacterium]|nr:hypothetical protein [Pirellulales bacterium]